MGEVNNYNKVLQELQTKRKEKETQYIRLFDKMSIQQSQFLINDIKDLDNDIKIVKNKISSLRKRVGDSND